MFTIILNYYINGSQQTELLYHIILKTKKHSHWKYIYIVSHMMIISYKNKNAFNIQWRRTETFILKKNDWWWQTDRQIYIYINVDDDGHTDKHSYTNVFNVDDDGRMDTHTKKMK